MVLFSWHISQRRELWTFFKVESALASRKAFTAWLHQQLLVGSWVQNRVRFDSLVPRVKYPEVWNREVRNVFRSMSMVKVLNNSATQRPVQWSFWMVLHVSCNKILYFHNPLRSRTTTLVYFLTHSNVLFLLFYVWILQLLIVRYHISKRDRRFLSLWGIAQHNDFCRIYVAEEQACKPAIMLISPEHQKPCCCPCVCGRVYASKPLPLCFSALFSTRVSEWRFLFYLLPCVQRCQVMFRVTVGSLQNSKTVNGDC